MTDPFTGEPMSQHPAIELLAAYLSGTLSPPEQATIETHMAACRPCRQEVTSARRLVRSRTSRIRWLVVAPAAAAAVLALMLGPAQLSAQEAVVRLRVIRPDSQPIVGVQVRVDSIRGSS